MNQAALCPSCKKDVVFDASGGASVCPACGAQFEIASEAAQRKRPRPMHAVVFLLWLFAPAAVALLVFAVNKLSGGDQAFGGEFSTVATIWIVLAAVSCYAACSWFAWRFSDRVWVRVLIGLLLGAGVFICNVIIAFFGGCAIFGA